MSDAAHTRVLTPRQVETRDALRDAALRLVRDVALDDITDPFDEHVLVKGGEEINEELAGVIEEAGLEKVRIRSTLTCETKSGICAKCYGRDLARGRMIKLGEAAGVIAAQSIGEPGTQLTMRTFHIGGTASRVVEQTTLSTKKGGIVKYQGLRTLKNQRGEIIVMNRNGHLTVQDENGREKERYSIVYAAKLGNAVSPDGNITLEPGISRTVHDSATADHQIVPLVRPRARQHKCSETEDEQ